MPALSAQALVSFVLLDLAVILVVARLAGTLCTEIGQPRVVGEILAGVLLGPTLLGPTLWPEFTGPAPETGTRWGWRVSPAGCSAATPAR